MQTFRIRTARRALLAVVVLFAALSLGACSGGAAKKVTTEPDADSSGGGGSGGGDAGLVVAKCAPWAIECAGVCVDPTTDSKHCGGCGKACGASTHCKDSACVVPTCPPPLWKCGELCVNFNEDPMNCGNCGNDCGAQGYCKEAVCYDLHPEGCWEWETLCGDVCVDTKYDPKNCGACGNTCGWQVECWESKCQICKQNFLKSDAFAVGDNPRSIAVGDLNGDGKLDIVAANEGFDPATTAGNGNTVSVLIGKGDGTFLPKSDFTVGQVPRAVVVGDLNGDGKLDLATANSDSTVSVLLGKGDGTFQPPSDITVGGGLATLVLSDLNGDGKLDLVASRRIYSSPDMVSVLLGKGDGTFLPKNDFLVGQGPMAVVVGDLNGDGNLDLATANDEYAWGQTVSVLLGKGDGTFADKSVYDVGLKPSSLALGDVNSDGKLDLVLANTNWDQVSVLLGNGDGTFPPPTHNYSWAKDPSSVALGDINGDGKLDLVSADYATGKVAVLLGKNDGTFLPKFYLPIATAPWSTVLADLNGDGKLDIAVADPLVDSVSVLLACTP